MDPLTLAIAGLAGSGGGSTEQNVSQTSTNTTSVTLSSVLSNMGQGGLDAGVSGGASGSGSSGTGQDTLSPSPLAFPNLGSKTLTAQSRVENAENPNKPNTGVFVASAVIAGFGLLYFMGGKKGKK